MRDAGSTPATSTILPSVYGASGAIAKLLPDYCPNFDGRIEYPRGSGIHISKRRNRCLKNAYGLSYLVEIPGRFTGCGRRRRQFKSLNKAVGFALLCAEGQKKMGQMFHQLPHRKLIEITLGAFVDPVASKKQATLLAEVIDELVAIKLELYENNTIRQRTYESIALQLQSIKRHFGRRGTDLITKNSIVRWLRSMPHSQRTKQNYLNALRELLKFAVARGYIDRSPSDLITSSELKQILGRKKEKEPSILSVEDAKKLLVSAHKNPQLGLLASVTLGLFCGLRTEEIKRLDWSCIQLDRGLLTVSASIAKKRRIRTINIPRNAVSILRHIHQHSGPVAPNRYSSEFQKKFLKLTRLADLEWKANSMRHSFGSYHYALYGDSVATSRELGHKTGDDILFCHYRALVSQEDAKKYWSVVIDDDN
jgi:integrase